MANLKHKVTTTQQGHKVEVGMFKVMLKPNGQYYSLNHTDVRDSLVYETLVKVVKYLKLDINIKKQ